MFSVLCDPRLAVSVNSPCDGSGFPVSLPKWCFTVCLMPYNQNVI